MPRPKSRPKRWIEAGSQAEAGLSALKELQEEYQEWYDNLPENLQGSELGSKLEAICDLDIESALDVVQESADLELPRGFGRD